MRVEPSTEIAPGAMHLPGWLSVDQQRRPFPEWLSDLGRQTVADAYGDHLAGHHYHPDIALINYYDAAARMGMHKDRDERTGAPVVSLSLGDPGRFPFR
jgi:alkylated DNA repair protein (DNA oxidative demethylase)